MFSVKNLILVSIIFITGCVSIAATYPSDRVKYSPNAFDYEISRAEPTLPRVVEDEIVEVETPIVKEEPKGRWAWALVTAYTPGPESCGIYADGKTSIGVNTKSPNPNHIYGIAADPRDIPYGTKVFIPEYWEMLQRNRNSKPTEMTEIDDTGSAMRHFKPHWRTVNGERVWIEFHFDARVRQVSTALQWGRQYLRVFVYH